jgi:hypothetical protein
MTRQGWGVTARARGDVKMLCGVGVLGASLAGCSVDAGLDVINGCESGIRVYSGSDNRHEGMSARVDDLSPHETAATYVPYEDAVIYVQPFGSNAWVGPLVVPPDDDGDGLVTYTVGPDVCEGVDAG